MKTKLMQLTIILVISVSYCFFGWTSSAYAILLTGQIKGIPESSKYTWGDGSNNLTADWSTHAPRGDGWFYGTANTGQTVDFYVAKDLTDPTTISNASVFTYSTGHGIAEEGDTVFFRGTNGYYGAWRIDEIYATSETHMPWSYLNGQWYFQSDGTGNFSSVPIPGTVLLLGSGLLSLVGLKRFRKR
jgi:hypothetical protein